MTLKHELTIAALGMPGQDSGGVLQQGEVQVRGAGGPGWGLTQTLLWWQVESGRAHPERAPRSATSAEGQGRCHGAAEGPQG